MQSPSRTTRTLGESLAAGLRAGLAAPTAPYVPPTPEEQAAWDLLYPQFTITNATAYRVYQMLRAFGYTVEVRYVRYPRDRDDGEYAVIITDRRGRRDDGQAPDIGDALDIAFRSFCNDRGGALRRAIAHLS